MFQSEFAIKTKKRRKTFLIEKYENFRKKKTKSKSYIPRRFVMYCHTRNIYDVEIKD